MTNQERNCESDTLKIIWKDKKTIKKRGPINGMDFRSKEVLRNGKGRIIQK